MLRFIDLRGQDTGSRFMFWDTVSDCPIATDPESLEGIAWNTFHEFEAQIIGRWPADYVQRMREIAPAWTRQPIDPKQDLTYDEGAPCILCQADIADLHNGPHVSRSELVSLLMGEP